MPRLIVTYVAVMMAAIPVRPAPRSTPEQSSPSMPNTVATAMAARNTRKVPREPPATPMALDSGPASAISSPPSTTKTATPARAMLPR